jgi:PilZ domain
MARENGAMADSRTHSNLGRRSNDLGKPDRQYVEAERRTGVVRRSGARARSLLSGKLVIDGGRISFDCVIRNMSSRGARVELAPSIELPATVGLLIVREGLLCDAKVVWRRNGETGLTFHGRHDLRRDADPARRGIRALWAAVAPL